MALTRIDSYLVDLDSLGGITFDNQAGVPTFKVDAITHRVGIGTASPTSLLDVYGGVLNIRNSLGFAGTLTNISSTGMYLTFADTVNSSAIGTNNGNLVLYNNSNTTPRLTINPSGNVGIGTTNPSYKLDVQGGGVTAIQVLSSGSDAAIFLKNTTPTTGKEYYISSYNSGGFGLVDATAGAARITVTSGGNVGIGTTNPAATLTVVGPNGAGLRIDQGNYNYYGAYNHVFRDSGLTSTFMTIDNVGNVGIGFTNPANLLELRKNTAAFRQSSIGESGGYVSTFGLNWSTTNTFIIDVNPTGASATRIFNYGSNGDLTLNYASTSTSRSFIITDGTSERLRVNSSGNVGIGTTNPVTNLHIASTGAPAVLIQDTDSANAIGSVGHNGGETTFTSRNGASNGSFNWYAHNGSTFTSRMSIDSIGRLMVNTTTPDSVSRFTISASSQTDYGIGINNTYTAVANSFYAHRYLQDGTHIGGLYWNNSTSSPINYTSLNGMYFRSGNAAAGDVALSITSSGNVGIGTTNPTTKLHVEGTGQFVATSSSSATSTVTAVYANTPLQTVSAFFGRNTSVTGLTGDQYSTSIRFNGAAVAWGDIAYYPNQGGKGHFRFSLASNSVETFPNAKVGVGSLYSAGPVGIGTTNPTQNLQVLGNEATAGKINAVGVTYGPGAFLNAFTTAGLNDLGFSGFIASQALQTNRLYIGVHSPGGVNESFIGTPDNNALALWTNATQRVTISSGGNVGIGTTNPAAKLHVESGVDSEVVRLTTINAEAQIRFLHNAGSTYTTTLGSQTLGANNVGLVFRTGTGSGSNSLVIDVNGNVGIGTANPTTKLHVEGEVKIQTHRALTSTTDYYTSGRSRLDSSWFIIRRSQRASGAAARATITFSASSGSPNAFHRVRVTQGGSVTLAYYDFLVGESSGTFSVLQDLSAYNKAQFTVSMSSPTLTITSAAAAVDWMDMTVEVETFEMGDSAVSIAMSTV